MHNMLSRFSQLIQNRPLTVIIIYALLLFPSLLIALLTNQEGLSWVDQLSTFWSTAIPYSWILTNFVHPSAYPNAPYDRPVYESLFYGSPVIYIYHNICLLLFVLADKFFVRVLSKVRMPLPVMTAIELPIFLIAVLLLGVAGGASLILAILLGLVPFTM